MVENARSFEKHSQSLPGSAVPRALADNRNEVARLGIAVILCGLVAHPPFISTLTNMYRTVTVNLFVFT